MNYHVLTLFPEMIENGMNTSITGRAITKGPVSYTHLDVYKRQVYRIPMISLKKQDQKTSR